MEKQIMSPEELADKLYDQLFTRYYVPHDKIFEKCKIIPVENLRERNIKDELLALLKSGERVKCGYTSSAIRGFHSRYIFIE